MIKYVLYQEDPPNEPVSEWYLFNEDPAVLIDRITNPKTAKIVKLDINPSIARQAVLLMEMTQMKISLGQFVSPGG